MSGLRSASSWGLISGGVAACALGIAAVAMNPAGADDVPRLAGEVVGAGEAGGAETYLMTCAHEAVQRPITYELTCGSGAYVLEGLDWSSWGGQSATATGVYAEEVCEPNCAEGYLERYEVEVTADRVLAKAGVASFGTVEIRFTGDKPSWATSGGESYDLLGGGQIRNADGSYAG